MDKTCAVKFCESRENGSKFEGPIHFFKFPRDEDVCRQWAEICGILPYLERKLWDKKLLHDSHLKVCSIHFEERMYAGETKKRLRANAVPTLYINKAAEGFEFVDVKEEVLSDGESCHADTDVTSLGGAADGLNTDNFQGAVEARPPLAELQTKQKKSSWKQHSTGNVEHHQEQRMKDVQEQRTNQQLLCQVERLQAAVSTLRRLLLSHQHCPAWEAHQRKEIQELLQDEEEEPESSGPERPPSDCPSSNSPPSVSESPTSFQQCQNLNHHRQGAAGVEDEVGEMQDAEEGKGKEEDMERRCSEEAVVRLDQERAEEATEVIAEDPLAPNVMEIQETGEVDKLSNVPDGPTPEAQGQREAPEHVVTAPSTSNAGILAAMDADWSYTCRTCDRTFERKSELAAHARMHAGEADYRCAFCNRGFSQKSSLDTHVRIHAGGKLFRCTECRRRFTLKASLVAHLLVHSRECPHRCAVCGKGFTCDSLLAHHMYRHTGERPYKCKVCGRGFMQAAYLAAHMRFHTGERPYRCAVCDEGFLHHKQLAAHARQHGEAYRRRLQGDPQNRPGAKPYACGRCKRGFVKRSSLDNHACNRLPFGCDRCDRRFAYRSQLRTHERVHSGERLHECEVCDKRFAAKSNLKVHMRNVHCLEDRSVGASILRRQLLQPS